MNHAERNVMAMPGTKMTVTTIGDLDTGIVVSIRWIGQICGRTVDFGSSGSDFESALRRISGMINRNAFENLD